MFRQLFFVVFNGFFVSGINILLYEYSDKIFLYKYDSEKNWHYIIFAWWKYKYFFLFLACPQVFLGLLAVLFGLLLVFASKDSDELYLLESVISGIIGIIGGMLISFAGAIGCTGCTSYNTPESHCKTRLYLASSILGCCLAVTEAGLLSAKVVP